MKRLLLTYVLVFSSFVLANDVCEQVHNWKKLNSLQQTKVVSLVSSIFKLEQDVLEEFKIPLNTTYYSTDLNVKYIGEYPNSKNATVVVGYVPLQFVEYYEDELQKFYDKRDDLNVIPRLDVILAIHYTESNFIPTALGGRKDNPAFGMMQLTLNTAEDLYRRDKEEYQKYFSIKDDKVVFNSTKSQVSLTIKFLTDIKKYTREYETAAVTRYNGVGDDAKAYASLVLSRARLYKKLRSGGKEISTEQFVAEYSTPEVKTVINNQVEEKGLEPLSDGDFKEAIERSILVYEYDAGSSQDKITLPPIDNGEIKTIRPQYFAFPPIPDDGCEYYVKVEQGRTLFSYFSGGIKDMVYTVCEHDQNKKYTLYYKDKSGKKILKSMHDIDTKNNNMQTDIKAGDVIYLPPDMVIKGDNNTLSNMLRYCKE